MISASAAKTVAGSAFSPPGTEPSVTVFESCATLCLIPAVSVVEPRAMTAPTPRGPMSRLSACDFRERGFAGSAAGNDTRDGTDRGGDGADRGDRRLGGDGARARARG